VEEALAMLIDDRIAPPRAGEDEVEHLEEALYRHSTIKVYVAAMMELYQSQLEATAFQIHRQMLLPPLFRSGSSCGTAFPRRITRIKGLGGTLEGIPQRSSKRCRKSCS